MRRKVVIAGLIILAIGAAMFFAGPYILRSDTTLSTDVSSLTSLKNSTSIQPGSTVALGTAPAGKIFAAVYNDSLSAPANVTEAGSMLSSQSASGLYIIEYYNTGSSSQAIYLSDNYTMPMTVNYSTLALSTSGLIYSILIVLLGGILMVVGGIIAVVGLILKPKHKDQPMGVQS